MLVRPKRDFPALLFKLRGSALEQISRMIENDLRQRIGDADLRPEV